MVEAVYWYGSVVIKAFNKEVDWNDGNVKCMLLADTYVLNQDIDDYLDDVNTHEVTGLGYTIGGQVLVNPTITYDGPTNIATFDADNVSWNPVTLTARWAVIYYSTGTSATSPLLLYIDFGGNKSPSNGPLTINWNAAGIGRATLS